MKEGVLVMMKLLSLGLSAAEWWKNEFRPRQYV
jgi:hypothetical protein